MRRIYENVIVPFALLLFLCFVAFIGALDELLDDD